MSDEKVHIWTHITYSETRAEQYGVDAVRMDHRVANASAAAALLRMRASFTLGNADEAELRAAHAAWAKAYMVMCQDTVDKDIEDMLRSHGLTTMSDGIAEVVTDLAGVVGNMLSDLKTKTEGSEE